MLLSIVIPCYNSMGYLRDCLESVLAQSFSDYEVVAIDDGSTDGTAQLLDEYSAKYRQIHVYHFPNRGVAIARKKGITLSHGDYIVFVDSDDTINPNLLEELSKAIESHGQPELIRYQAVMVNDAPHKDHERYNFASDLDHTVSGIEALKMWSTPGKKYAVYWLFAFRATIFSKVLFVTTLRCYEDVALIPVLVAASDTVVTIGYAGYNYTCDNSESLTNSDTLEAEKQRADDFYQAYLYAVENFTKLHNVTARDIAFFVEDYMRRLHGKYDSLPDILKPTFEYWFK